MRRRRSLIAAIVLGMCIFELAFAQVLPEIYRPDPKFPDGFIDLDLKIESMNCPTWDNCRVRAKGLHQGAEVGVQIQIARTKGRSLGIHYQSVGESSDRLLTAIAQLYKIQATSKRFRKDTYADLVVLQATNDVMANKVFFFADGPESKYAELYTNIDRKKGVLQIHEKDEEYRPNVFKALSE
jgi:hypothetical protein